MQFELAETHESGANQSYRCRRWRWKYRKQYDRSGITGVEFIAVNTDAQALTQSLATLRFQLGQERPRAWVLVPT